MASSSLPPLVNPAGAPSSLAKRLNRTHRDYDGELMDRFHLLVEGGAALKKAAYQFLIKRPKEPGDVFSERCNRFTYQNIIGTVIAWYVSAAFRKEPIIESDPGELDPYYADFHENCDRGEKSLTDFFADVLSDVITYGRSFILIDKPKPTHEVVSLADEKEQGLDRPYIARFNPRDVINWSTDDSGNLVWALIRTVDHKQVFEDDKIRVITDWYYYDSIGYKHFQNVQIDGGSATDPVEMDSGPHALSHLGIIPVRMVKVPRDLWLMNRGYLQLLEHLNQDNTYSWALFMANLPVPIITGQANMDNVTLAEYNYLHLTDPQAKFGWAEPSGISFEHSQVRLASLREELYRVFYLQAQGRSSAATPAMQSGYSKELDMAPTEDILNKFGGVLRSTMQSVLNMIAQSRSEDVAFDVRWPRFSRELSGEELSVSTAVLSMNIGSDTFEKQVKKNVARGYLSDANEELLNQVEAEIEAAPTDRELAEEQMERQSAMFDAEMAGRAKELSEPKQQSRQRKGA